MTRDGTTPELDSRELISTLFALLPIPVAVADENGLIVIANSSFAEIFRGVDSVSTMPLREMEVPGYGRFQVQALPMNERGYKIVYATDVSVPTQLAGKVERLEKLAAIGRVVGGVANELHSPLKDILDYGPLMERCEMDSLARTMAQAVFTNAERAGQLVQNLITFAGALGSERVPIDLNEIVRNVMAQRRVRDSWRQFDVTLELERELPRSMGNPSQIEQLISALIVHAEHAVSRVSNTRGIILVQTGMRDGRVQVQVADNGSELDTSRVFASNHTGVSLNICGEIAKDHGGELFVWSAYGNGSTFTLELPICALDSADAGNSPDRSTSMRDKSVIVIDDEVHVSELVADVLSGRGMNVEVFTSGADAWEHLSSRSVDLVICDQMMPGLSGESLFRLMESATASMNRRFLFITDNAITAQSRKFLVESGVRYLRKPFRIQDLLEAVEGLLSRSQPRGF